MAGMPKLRDVSVAVKKVGVVRLTKDVFDQVNEDDVLTWAAALAYSWLLAIFPFLIFLLTLLPYIPEAQKKEVLGGIDGFLKQLPAETAATIGAQVDATIKRVLTETQSGLMSIGLLLALWAASGGMAATMTAIDRCYDIETSRAFYWHRLRAIILTAITASLMLLVVVLLPVGSIVLTWMWSVYEKQLGSHLPPWMLTLRLAIDVARWVLALFLLAIVLNVVYHFGCQVKKRFRFVTPGAVFCIVTWIAMALGFKYYIDVFAIGGYNKTYGAIGGVVILLFLFYLAAIILLVGAEINSEIDYVILGTPRGSKDFRPAEQALKARKREQTNGGHPDGPAIPT